MAPDSEDIRHVSGPVDGPAIVIIDEFDRMADRGVETAIADTIKTLSDNTVDATLMIVGAADSLNQLIAEHKSIQRAIREIPVTRMSKSELLEIVDKGLSQCKGLSIEPDPHARIADDSQCLPLRLISNKLAISLILTSRSSHFT